MHVNFLYNLKKGNEIAKELSTVIIQKDQLSGLVEGITYGRLLRENIIKGIGFMNRNFLTELVPAIFTFILNVPTVISASAILGLDLLLDIAPVIAFASEKPEMDNMLDTPLKMQKITPNSFSNYFQNFFIFAMFPLIACSISFLIELKSHNLELLSPSKSQVYWYDPNYLMINKKGKVIVIF